jgi:Polyketide cyclase / dehydrase and lipid transport
MMQTIYATARSGASPQAVWGLLADVDTWPRWAAFDSAELERPGKPDIQGVDAIRRFRRGRYTTRERVTAFEPARRLGYELLSGIPVRDYRAEVTLEPDLDGTLITWRSSFRGRFPIPAGVVQRGLQAFIADTVEGLARAAEGA